MKPPAGMVIGAAVLAVGCGATTPRPPALAPRCQPVISLYLHQDPELAPALQIAQRDPRVQRASGETRAQTYARFTRIFKDQPELLKNTRQQDLPPTIRVWPRSTDWATIDALRTELANKTMAKDSSLAPKNEAAALRCQTQPPPSATSSGR